MPAEKIVIAEYDPGWPAAFEAEKDRIVGALGAVTDGVVAIEHVGSTAVPGLAAKRGVQSAAVAPCLYKRAEVNAGQHRFLIAQGG